MACLLRLKAELGVGVEAGPIAAPSQPCVAEALRLCDLALVMGGKNTLVPFRTLITRPSSSFSVYLARRFCFGASQLLLYRCKRPMRASQPVWHTV